jgi:hypothetical protein
MIFLYLKVLATRAQEVLTAMAVGQAAAGPAMPSAIGVAPNALAGQREDGFRTRMFVFRPNPRRGAAR